MSVMTRCGLWGVFLVFSLRGLASFEALPPEVYLASLVEAHEGQQRPSMNRHEVLNFIARKKAEDMAERGFFSHLDPEGYGPNFSAHQAGYALEFGNSPGSNSIESIGVRHQNRLSENRAAEIVFESWLESPGHRRHVLGEVAQFRDHVSFGVGYAFASKGPFGWSSHYFVFVSANQDEEASVSPFVIWKFEQLSLAEMDHQSDDLDGDGRNTLWEYVLGSSPHVADSEPPFTFSFDRPSHQGLVSLPLKEPLDPAVDIIVETTDFSRGSPWSRDGVVRAGRVFRAGSRDDLVRLFRVRLEHSQFSRLIR